jgi:small-conductance mechanosensitive channel
MDTGAFLLTSLKPVLPWLPAWGRALAAIVLIVVAAYIAQWTLVAVLSRFFKEGRTLAERVFQRTKGVVRFGFVIIAASILTPALHLKHDQLDLVRQCLLAAFILLIGWIAVVTTSIVADRYLMRLTRRGKDSLQTRSAQTQVRVLIRAIHTLIILLAIGAALMTFQDVREFGISIFASAGMAGLILGLAARPMLENLIAGIQIAVTQPIRIDDVVVVEGEWGQVEELNSTYITIRVWDRRRLILPLNYFLEKPFENWTHKGTSIIGTVMLYLDYTAPVDRLRAKLHEILAKSELWDRDVASLQVTDAKTDTIEVRVIVSAANSSDAWNLRCELREKLLEYIRSELPHALPRRRNTNVLMPMTPDETAPSIELS